MIAIVYQNMPTAYERAVLSAIRAARLVGFTAVGVGDPKEPLNGFTDIAAVS
jgi:hypothetical protein